MSRAPSTIESQRLRLVVNVVLLLGLLVEGVNMVVDSNLLFEMQDHENY